MRNASKKGNRESALQASMGLRLPEFLYSMQDPGYMRIFREQWSTTRMVRGIAAAVGLSEHPDLLAIANKTNRNLHAKTIARVLYRADLQGQFADVAAGRDEHMEFAIMQEKGTAQIEKALGVQQPAKKVTEGTIVQQSFHQHLSQHSQ